ncbi:DUF2157 domain-containing protein [Buttiauxella sp. 3AFRM03]|uniref:DUF2157 domain-containing protein n=1 Tax=Buttiauxella sp. 3AFRM03 TaxID=2479367 RepID=UPI000EF7EB84|nr:DUF2157 domain-containing protein [Buttiauxella sp. 3AFRM03]AYN25878.1 DUF2157 domain-containing protein [Buttiauxella sp. 3AFRM03]
MKVTRKQEKVIRHTLEGWREEGVIDETEQQRLQQNLSLQLFDWQHLSRYAFWIALACAIIAIGSLVADEYLMALLFNFGYFTRAIILALISAGLYFWSFRRQKITPEKRYSNEAILFMGVLFTALCLSQVGMALDTGSGNVAPLFLLGCAIYGAIGYLGRSGLIWLFCLLAACYLLKPLLQQRNLFNTSKAMGLLYLFIALWILSIFGNYDFDIWQSVRQIELLHWSLLFALAALACIWISLKTDDGMLRGFGLTFLGINLYTRYFELFWDGTNKVIFFLLLAISLALVGRYAERIWRVGEAGKSH